MLLLWKTWLANHPEERQVELDSQEPDGCDLLAQETVVFRKRDISCSGQTSAEGTASSPFSEKERVWLSLQRVWVKEET